MKANSFIQDLVIDGQALELKDEEDKIHAIDLGLNPITIDPDNEWIYYGAMNSQKMYRIPASVLADASLTSAQVHSKIKLYGKKSAGPVAIGR